jgi:hypothetical protein
MIGPRHVELIAEALDELLGTPAQGDVAFVRCLPSGLVDALVDAPGFAVVGWTVHAVVDRPGCRRITADQAVEHREDKADPALFLIDPQRAGAGLDGIYSAAREIGEADLLGKAQERARRKLWGKGGFLRAALRRAERLGRRNRLTPWQIFDFYVTAGQETPGAAVAKLGLWPIHNGEDIEDRQLDLAAALSERLLFAQDARSIDDRVRALLLDDPTGEKGPALACFLRDIAGQSPLQAMATLVGRPDLWLGAIDPRFSGEELRAIRLVSWRGPSGSVARWSGLRDAEVEGSKPRLILDRTAAAKDQARLELRWTVEPDTLATGAVEYSVNILAGDEVLAEVTVAHRDKSPQKAVFSVEDFEELDSDAKFEAFVRVAVVGADGVAPVDSEEIVLQFGQIPATTTTGSGQIVRTLADGAIAIATRAGFDEVIKDGHLPPRASEDKKGFIGWRQDGGRSVRVQRPALIRDIEESWRAENGAIGRWVVRVRADGSPVDQPVFQAIEPACDPGIWDRLAESSRKLAADIGPLGLLARVHGAKWAAASSYINAWIAAFEDAAPKMALHGTVEVQSVSGRTLGMIVTPLHPLRFAWHSAYDQLAAHARYEQGLLPTAVQKAMGALDSSHFPAALPGASAGGSGFVFADTLGLHAVTMTVDGEREPKAAVALMTVCLGGGSKAVAPSIGEESADILAREIRYYLDCHRRPSGSDGSGRSLLSIQAWRPGDGMTVARALGAVLREEAASITDDEEREPDLCFTLDLYHPPGSTSASGAFLIDVGRRRRTGGVVLDARDRWMTETAGRPGEIVVPRLRWARREEPAEPGDDHAATPLRPSHLSLAFDMFEARLEARPSDSLAAEARPMHAFGLAKVMERRVDVKGDPEWTVFAPPRLEGEKAPDNRTATERLLRLDTAIARATARFLGGGPGDWPVLVTRLPPASQLWIDRLHERSDWVVTVDRNACLEYFDAPRGLPAVYERFVIDAVPERTNLGALQLVTSTSNLDEVRALVDEALGAMGLSSSERNSRFLLAQLKALSGRLAIRLANPYGRTGEMIALALMQANCAQTEDPSGTWLDLQQGFLVPVDEIVDLTVIAGATEDTDGSDGSRRADFVHVRTGARGSLEFRFVEVKHRLHLKTARQPELLSGILRQTGDLRRRWHGYFFADDLKPVERSLRRSRLARILWFYADRAARHRLAPQAHDRLRREIDQLLLKESYRPAEIDQPDIGYIFCPEHRAGRAEPLYVTGGEAARLWLFGPSLLPEERSAAAEPLPPAPEMYETALGATAPEPQQESAKERRSAESTAAEDGSAPSAENEKPRRERRPASGSATTSEAPVDIVLGTAAGGNDEVSWRVSIRANPHLMIVGLPGMGKTTCLINICRQLAGAGIAPIVFSYHDDIDDKLGDALGDLKFVDYDGLGFNPLRVDSPQPIAYVDVAGTLRDIFAAIFPDLGDLQLEELRQAIKQSYTDLGWGDRAAGAVAHATPRFGAFLDILTGKPKPNLGLLARLRELADYGFFENPGDGTSLLDEMHPTIVRIHATANGMLQNAFSSFVLYSLYKDMFRRGVQSRLTHAVIFDEAHRAARLKLIPQLGKECRKYGLALGLASQEAKDFDPSLFAAVGSYLALRVSEPDARTLARMTGSTLDERRNADRLKALEKYTAIFFGEGRPRPTSVHLAN